MISTTSSKEYHSHHRDANVARMGVEVCRIVCSSQPEVLRMQAELYLNLSRVGWARPKLETQQEIPFMLTYKLT